MYIAHVHVQCTGGCNINAVAMLPPHPTADLGVYATSRCIRLACLLQLLQPPVKRQACDTTVPIAASDIHCRWNVLVSVTPCTAWHLIDLGACTWSAAIALEVYLFLTSSTTCSRLPDDTAATMAHGTARIHTSPVAMTDNLLSLSIALVHICPFCARMRTCSTLASLTCRVRRSGWRLSFASLLDL